MKAGIATAVVGLAVAAACAPAAQAERTTAGGPTPEQAAELGRQAYVYGLPLLEFARVRKEQTSVACPTAAGNAPVNTFANAKHFPSPEDRTVVAPNTDTLYSISHLDLGHGPIVLGHPNMGKRYFSFQLLDPYTNVIDFVGSRTTGSKAGKFAIRWNEKKGNVPKGMPVIRSKYRRVWIIGRTLATDEADQKAAYKKMKKYRLSRVNRKPKAFPKDCDPGPAGEYPVPTNGESFINRLDRKLASNPPPKRDEPLLDRLATVGIGPGLSPEDAGLTPDALGALYDAVSDEAASFPTATRLSVLQQAIASGGWLIPKSDIGDYGTDYQFRAQVSVIGLGANTPDEAIYPTGITDSSGALLNGANDYRITFPPGETPPARYFWSLTVYDSNGFLAPNPIDRYSIGPSHPPLAEQPDGSIVVVLSGEDPADDDVNWLPTPDAGFRLNLRLYGPRKAALNGEWAPPPTVKVVP